MDVLRTDLKYALRLWRKAPGFTAIAIATLALGIGANTAIFSTIDAVMIHALPYFDPDRVVMVWEDVSAAGYPRNTPAPGNYTEWARLSRSFTGIAATRGAGANVTADGSPEFILGRGVTANFFPVLGVSAIAGRTFTEDEDRIGAPVVVISYGLWQRRYGGDPAIVGRTMLLDDNKYEVIGVMPRGFVFRNRDIDYWVPIHFLPAVALDRGSHYLNVVARLRPGVSLSAARADMTSVAEELKRQYPTTNRRVGAAVVPIKEDVLGDTRIELLVLMGAAAAVLLIACANLASLLLSRAVGRRGELAVRSALGATRSRLVGQMVIEAIALSLAGGVAGIVVARASLSLVAQLTPLGFFQSPLSILDGRLLAFTVAVSILTGLLFSMVPAIQAAGGSLGDALQHGSRSSVGGRARLTRDALVVAQIAAALVLLVGAGLMLRTLANLRAIDIGFRPEHLLTLRTSLPRARYADSTTRMAFFNRVVTRVRALPGVENAGYGSNLPFTARGNTTWFQLEGVTLDPNDPGDALLRSGTNGYLKTLGVVVAEGRVFDDRDTADGPKVAVINDTMARKYFPDGSALGHHVRINPNQPFHTIVGVVRDVRERGYELQMKPGIYLPYAQAPTTWAVPESLVLRSGTNPADLAGPVRRVIGSVDPDQPVTAVRTMDEIIDLDVSDRHQQMLLLSAFASLALLLATIGLYGVLSYAVTQRSRELGLRKALGASAGSLVRMVVSRGLALTAMGLVLGLGLAWMGARTLQSLLYGVTAADPATFAAVVGMLGTIALAACYLPARRASRVDPMVVLREE
ncbi:MAG TPA: ABC transporter permease [Vicinamibacterales bacterium]|nr:ABC transporter permease [Vicinamibacterales bacterium]